MKNRRISLAVTVAAVTLALSMAGCASGGATGAGGSPSPSSEAAAATQSAAPTPTPSASATAPRPTDTDSSDWVITSTGLGPFRLGGVLPEPGAGALASYEVNDGNCPNPDVRFYVSDAHATVAVVLDAGAGTIDSILVSAGQADASAAGLPKTAQGIGVGASEAEVLAAYPDAAVEESHNLRYYKLTENAGPHIELMVLDGHVGRISVQTDPRHFYEICG